jgi:hypothetical protein
VADEIKNVFISHIHEDDAGLADLKGICEKNGLEVKDSSINSAKPNATKTSEWVNWEIEYAAKLGKRIVGVWEQGAKDCELPEALDKLHDAVVGWHGESIVDAITGKSNGSYSCDGELREYRPPKRYSC